MALPPPIRAGLALVLTALAVAGCTDGGEVVAPADHPLRPQEAPIRIPDPLPDTRSAQLGAVPGDRPVYPVSIHGGDLRLTGTVTGPTGPVEDARVLLERFVGEQSASLEVRTDSSGTWQAIGVWGGRYRMRAWRAPDLAMASSDLRFVPAEDAPAIDLRVDRFDGADLTGDVDDPAPDVGQTAIITVLATHQQVDVDGIVTTAPAEGRDAVLTAVGPWRPQGSPTVVFDGAGQAQWALTCTDEGSVTAQVAALSITTTLSAFCEAPPDEEPEPPAVDEPEPDFPVGTSFTPPFRGPIPAGNYTVTDDPGTCVLTYEAWAGDHWDPARRTVTGTGDVVIGDIARNLESLGDAPPCTYRRTS